MDVVILAGGYATRLYPLTLTRPKALLPVAGKPIIDYVLDGLGRTETIYLVTNDGFASQFEQWAAQKGATVVNDGSNNDGNKLGAIGDLNLVITRKHVSSDLIVVAADNLFTEPLVGFREFCREKDAPVVAIYDVRDLEAVKKFNNIAFDADGQITFFEEKPEQPISTLTAIALYYYPRATVPLIQQYVAEGNNPDQPGRLVQWLYQRTPVYVWKIPGMWYDIGSKETLEAATHTLTK